MKTNNKIWKVIHFTDGIVMVFDFEGQQITKHQGRYEDVKNEILKNVCSETEFFKAKTLQGDYDKIEKKDF